MEKNRAIDEVLLACTELVERGLAARTWGNISCRVDEKRFIITPSGIGYDRLTRDNIVEVDIETLEYSDGVKPSSEKGIHAAAYKLQPGTNFVIHTHQTYATCLSVAGFPALKPTAEETEILGGKVLLSSYGLPGTKRLRGNTARALAQGCRALLMERHGALLAGPDRETAFRRSVTLEDICRRAAKVPDFCGAKPDGVSRRQGADAFSYTDTNGERTITGGTSGGDIAARVHAALYTACPQFETILHRASPAVEAVLSAAGKLPALIDDFAQIVGGDARRCDAGDIAGITRAIKGRGGVLVSGLGAVACAKEASDAEAILTLMEKNALAWLNAAAYGTPKALPWLDRKLMRIVYTRKYSKQK